LAEEIWKERKRRGSRAHGTSERPSGGAGWKNVRNAGTFKVHINMGVEIIQQPVKNVLFLYTPIQVLLNLRFLYPGMEEVRRGG
jgi:hypothetical protein